MTDATLRRALIPATLTIAGLSLAAAVFLWWDFDRGRREGSREAREHATEVADRVTAEIERRLRSVEIQASAFQADLSESMSPARQADRIHGEPHSVDAGGPVARPPLFTGVADEPSGDRLEELLRQQFRLNPELYEVGVAFAPYAYDPSLRLYGVGIRASGGDAEIIELDAEQDYTMPGTAWFETPLQGAPVWLEPGRDETGRRVLATYAAPLVGKGAEEPIGVIYFSLSVDSLWREFQSLSLGEHGHGFVLSAAGRFVSHPIRRLVDGQVSIFEVPEVELHPRLIPLARRAIAGERVGGDIRDLTTRQPASVIFAPIEPVGWTVGLVYAGERVRKAEGRQLVQAAAALGLFLFCVVAATGWRRASGDRRLWVLSIGLAGFCLWLCIAVLIVAWRFPSPPSGIERTRIANRAALNQYIAGYNQRVMALRGELPIHVPTGIYVQSITFVDANDVRLTGYIWQRYEDGLHDGISRGFVMPESEDSQIEEAYTKRDGSAELYAWRFAVVLHQAFDYAHFPLGRENVWVQLWHKDFYKNVVLVPDFDSYLFTGPSMGAGVLENLVLPGWRLEESYFSYTSRTYQTNFGLGDYSGLTDFPELYFNIGIRKSITGPIVSDFLPLSIVVLMLFTILMMTSRQKSKLGLLGFTSMDVVAACGGFFLVVIFNHIGLRNRLAASGIIYLEYFYFVTYILILGVTMNAFLFANTQNRFVHYRDNLLPELLYWPFSQITILFLTLLAFY